MSETGLTEQMQQRTTIDIIRHGEPVGGRKYRGFQDDPLSEKGWQQMRDAVADFSEWDSIVSSPLLRCIKFAEKFSGKHQKPLQVDPRFKEIDWGVWQGCTTAEICRDDPDKILKFRAAPLKHTPENAESVVEFSERVVSAWQDLIQQYKNQHILLVAHAGIIRSVMCHVLDAPAEHMFRIYVSSAAITRFEIVHTDDGDHARLMFHDGRVSP